MTWRNTMGVRHPDDPRCTLPELAGELGGRQLGNHSRCGRLPPGARSGSRSCGRGQVVHRDRRSCVPPSGAFGRSSGAECRGSRRALRSLELRLDELEREERAVAQWAQRRLQGKLGGPGHSLERYPAGDRVSRHIRQRRADVSGAGAVQRPWCRQCAGQALTGARSSSPRTGARRRPGHRRGGVRGRRAGPARQKCPGTPHRPRDRRPTPAGTARLPGPGKACWVSRTGTDEHLKPGGPGRRLAMPTTPGCLYQHTRGIAWSGPRRCPSQCSDQDTHDRRPFGVVHRGVSTSARISANMRRFSTRTSAWRLVTPPAAPPRPGSRAGRARANHANQAPR